MSRTGRIVAGVSMIALLALAGRGQAEEEERPAGIHFHHDLDEGRRVAKESGRPLVLYFTFDT